MPVRDDFSAAVKRTLANRAGNHCSNPACRVLTAGPEENSTDSINVGEAAHITAASLGGRRYDPTLTAEQRSAQDNGIWLCAACANRIDKGKTDYSVETLREWKRHAESAARKGLEHPHQFAAGETNAYTVAAIFRFTKPSQYFETYTINLPPGKQFRAPITIRPLGGQTERAQSVTALPLILDARFGPSSNATVFVLQLENVGTAVEQHASIKLRIKGAPIWKVKCENPTRMIPCTQPSERKLSGVAGYSISNLMPKECVSATVYSHRPGPFDGEWYCTSTSEAMAPMVFDVLFGKPEVIPSWKVDTEFDRKNYPFE